MKQVNRILLAAFIFAGCTTNISDPITPTSEIPEEDVVVIAKNLQTPWSIAFLPSGDVLVTERSGTITRINPSSKSSQEITGVPNSVETAEGGLMGLTLHPQFSQNQFIYLYHTTRINGQLVNQVLRFRLQDSQLIESTVIIGQIQAAQFHDGGAIAFGPDGYLYITTGDAQNDSTAQNTTSLNGKILRLTANGEIPADNPFGNAVYAYGFRNPQGIAWDNQNNLWAVDHGPSGTQSGQDEVNLVVKGGNYGWPIIRGDQTREGMVSPSLHSGSTDTWAPSSLAFFNGSLYFTGLRGEALYQLPVQNGVVATLQTHFQAEFGRLRSVRVSPDNQFYVATSNRDGRGTPAADDDRILSIRF